ncbi:MAG TPA: hypothetical protein VM910_09435, partial [Bradyrhizobium sp.]|nr:hypothetical protein [Bradyrhizobium sp.]
MAWLDLAAIGLDSIKPGTMMVRHPVRTGFQDMTIQTVSLNKSYGGMQGVYKHASRETKTDMTFSVYVP